MRPWSAWLDSFWRCDPTDRQPPRLRGPGSASAFFPIAPLLITFQDLGREAVHALIVEPLRMPTGYPHQLGHRLFGNLHEPGCRSDATAFPEMTDDILGFRLWELGIEQSGAASFGELLPIQPTAQ